ncbi:MAG: hypothetical protein WAS33_26975, partial [Candidatus Promineifilaceae bacterium]
MSSLLANGHHSSNPLFSGKIMFACAKLKERRFASKMLNIYFSDFFQVSPEKISEYGAFNISLINDLPLLID